MLRPSILILICHFFALGTLCSAFLLPPKGLESLRPWVNTGHFACSDQSRSPRAGAVTPPARRSFLHTGALTLRGCTQAATNSAMKADLLAAIREFNTLQERDGKAAIDFGVKGGELEEKSRAPRNLAKGGGFYAISEDVGKAADRVFEIVEQLKAVNPTPKPTEFFGTADGEKCPLHGEWKLLFTTAADATFSKNSSRGDAQASNEVDGVRGKVMNIIEFKGGADGKTPALQRLRVRLAAKAISDTTIQLRFRYVKASLSRFLGLPLPLTLFLPVPGPTLTRLLFFWSNKTPPLPQFEVLYVDEELRVHRTLEDNLFIQARPDWEEAWR